MSVGMEMEEDVNDKKKETLCAVRNPKDRSNNPWFYNIFLEHIYEEEKKKRNKKTTKVNWLIALTQEEISELRGHTLKVYPLVEDISLEVVGSDKYKDGFSVLLNLFNSVMKVDNIKNKIKKLLTEDGKPSKDYLTIIKTKKILEEDWNERIRQFVWKIYFR